MADLVLFTKVRELTTHLEEKILTACLLVYDQSHFSDERLSNDLREQLEVNPTLSRIYVVAPLIKHTELIERIQNGSAKLRVSDWSTDEGAFLRVISAERPIESAPIQLFEHFFEKNASSDQEVIRKTNLSSESCQGWLFDLFVKSKAMVLAPTGVHFGKTSGKHSDRFLRAANVLSNSACCRLIAFFCLPLIPAKKFRQLYVDTLPLIAVGFALAEVGRLHGLVIESGMIISFGSYSGASGNYEFRHSDLLLVSASTSGSLVNGLIEQGADKESVITLFYLHAKSFARTACKVLCDLTHDANRQFGYAETLSYKHSECPHCKQGLLLAEFEGDQFLLQRRKTQRLKITKASQAKSAREFFELACRNETISVLLVGPGRSKYSDIHIDANKLLETSDELRSKVTFSLRRSVPTPVDFVVSDDISIADLSTRTAQNGKLTIRETTPLLPSSALSTEPPVLEGGALVYFGALHNDLSARTINRALRIVLPRGSISYFVVVLIAESPEARRDLITFLKYGDRGPNTFVFESVYDVQLSQRQDRLSWDLERDFLARIVNDCSDSQELKQRLTYLRQNSRANNSIFLQGQNGELRINNDFVYLDTKERNRDLISQADVYAIVCNLLTACRNDNRDIAMPAPRGSEAIVWQNSVYGQILLCPRNFKDFNDGVLHAALLRGATPSELSYYTDEALSEEVLEVMVDEVKNWEKNSGQALAEFCLAVSTGRLRLKADHLEEFLVTLRDATYVPEWVKCLCVNFRDGLVL